MTTITEALDTFTLISGKVGSETSKKACAMSLLAWINGDGFTDHPECAHRLIADVVIRANDSDCTTADREGLVRLGEHGALDTWWIPSIVIVWAMSGERDEEITDLDRAKRMLGRIIEWKSSKVKPNLRNADLRFANLRNANLSFADLSNADLRNAPYGDQSTILPLGYAVTDGRIVKTEENP